MKENYEEVVMTGITEAYYKKVYYSLIEVIDGLREPIDNAINALATEIRVSFDEKGNYTFYNNGPGMTHERLYNVMSSVCSHFKITNGKENSIHGVGLKDVMLRLAKPSNPFTGEAMTKGVIKSAVNEKSKITICTFDINPNSKTVPFTNIKIWDEDNTDNFIGVSINIKNGVEPEPTMLTKYKKSVRDTYPLVSDGRTFFINNEQIVPEDHCYLELISDVIPEDTPRVYIREGIIFIVKKTFVAKKNGEFASEKLVGVFLPDKDIYGWGDTPYQRIRKDNDKNEQESSGIYSSYNGRIIESGGNMRHHLGRADNGGGIGRMRIFHTMDNSPEVFKVSTNKSQQLPSYCTNDELSIPYEKKNSFFSDITKMGSILHSIYTKGEKNCTELTEYDVTEIVRTTFKNNNITIKDREIKNQKLPEELLEISEIELPNTFDCIDTIILHEGNNKKFKTYITGIKPDGNKLHIYTNSLEDLTEEIKKNILLQIISSYKTMPIKDHDQYEKSLQKINKEIAIQNEMSKYLVSGEIKFELEKEENTITKAA